MAHSPWSNITRTRMNSGVEQKRGRLDLFGPSYLQHILSANGFSCFFK
jgi:hypothetical protein